MGAICPRCECAGYHLKTCCLRANPDVRSYERQIEELETRLAWQRQELAQLDHPVVRRALAEEYTREHAHAIDASGA